MTAIRGSVSSAGTRVPLSIPLHFSPVTAEEGDGSKGKATGPTLPRDWRQYWANQKQEISEAANSYLSDAASTTSSNASDTESVEWQETELQRWITCVTAWDADEGSLSSDNAGNSFDSAFVGGSSAASSSAPQVKISGASGANNNEDRSASSRPHIAIGDKRGGRRIALGTQDGNVWLFVEQIRDELPTPASQTIEHIPESPGAHIRSGSRTSLTHLSPTSPTSMHSINGSSRHPDREAVTSPVLAVSGMSDVQASACSLRGTTTDTDAEEKLEKQWHAGRGESHSMMSNVMEALRLQNNEHHDHRRSVENGTAQSSPGSSSPLRRHGRQSIERKPRLLRQLSQDMNVSHLDQTTSQSKSPLSETTFRSPNVKAELMNAMELRDDRRSGKRIDIPRDTGAALTRTSSFSTTSLLPEEGPGSKGKQREPRVRPLHKVDPILSLQCPSSDPVTSVVAHPSKEGHESLVIVQEGGKVTLWNLDDRLTTRSIDLRRAKAVSEQTETASHIMPHAAESIHHANVNIDNEAPQPSTNASSKVFAQKAVAPTGVSQFVHLPIERSDSPSAAMDIVGFFDKTNKDVYLVDIWRQLLLLKLNLQDTSESTPTLRMTCDPDCIEVLSVLANGHLASQKARITPVKTVKPAEVEAEAPIIEVRATPLSSAVAFLRREGISRPSSKAPSIVEDATEFRKELATPNSHQSSRAPSIMDGAGDGKKDLATSISHLASKAPSIVDVVLDDRRTVGAEGVQEGASSLQALSDGRLLSWGPNGLSMAKSVEDSIVALDSASLNDIEDIVMASNDTALVLMKDALQEIKITALSRFEMGIKIGKPDGFEGATSSASCTAPISCCRNSEDRLVLLAGEVNLWQGEIQAPNPNSHDITASLPFSMERIAVSLASGHLVLCTFSELVEGLIPAPEADSVEHRGTVTLLQVVIDPRSRTKYIFGGTQEGDVVIWDAITLKQQEERSLLVSPIVSFLTFGHQDNSLRLHGCVACISADSTIAFMDLKGMKDLFIVPGRDATLEVLAVRSDELLLVYNDGRARLWKTDPLELQRTMDIEQAQLLLDDGQGWWAQFPIGADYLTREKGNAGVLSSMPASRAHLAGTLTADVRRLVEAASRMVAPPHGSDLLHARELTQLPDHDEMDIDADPSLPHLRSTAPKASISPSRQTVQEKKALHTLRPLLGCLLPFGLNAEIDELCRRLLGQTEKIGTTCITSGIFSEPAHFAANVHSQHGSLGFATSAAVSTTRLLAVTAMLLIISRIQELEQTAHELVILLGNLSDIAGENCHTPAASILIDYLTDSTVEIRQAAQAIFVSSLDAVPIDHLDAICEQWSEFLPNRIKTAKIPPEEGSEQDLLSSKALLVLGLVASQRYTALPPTLLKDISTSVVLYLDEENSSAHQSVAILLCERGFSIFQHYFDAMEVLRSLFTISTLAKEAKESSEVAESKSPVLPAASENRDGARQATLRIAEVNTPLFMTTLSLDILHARSPAHCSATMRLVAFMVRRKPMVLYPNLPRLAEAVIKSLDPTITAMRSVIHRSATIIISELVNTYPTIAFHKGLQRLAVGTFEGAIIMYDLKTATRLYVLEAHPASLNGVTFSNDGRRLISICLRDGMVKVWKTGVGLRSLFSFGNAPRQISALLGSASATQAESGGGVVGAGGSLNNLKDDTKANHAHRGTPPYKSFDFGRLAAAALATTTLTEGKGATINHLHSSHEGDDTFMTDLDLVKFEWLGERSIKILIGEASMVIDVA